MQLAQIEETIDAAQEVVVRDVVFEIEGVKQRRLACILSSHHLVSPHSPDGKVVDQLPQPSSIVFFNRIGRKQKSLFSGQERLAGTATTDYDPAQ